jgi:DNA polymerase I-like protein with 3'-5' exonuclease and polymerase domains
VIAKKYTIVTNRIQLESLVKHIEEHDYFGFDTETTGLNVRKEKVIGFSLCGEPGMAFYFPIETWDNKQEKLVEVWDKDTALSLLEKLKDKELIMWNASFDIRVVKNYFGIDLINSLIAEAMLLKHTLEEEGDFALKKVAIQNQEALGLDMEAEANKEQLELKENVKKNGGSTTRDNYEMFKADLEVMGPYAAADADLTLRLSLLYREKLEKEGLVDFFFNDEVMPFYKYVTIPMEDRGIALDLDLMNTLLKETNSLKEQLKKEITSELLDIPTVQQWYDSMLEAKYPAKKTGAFGQKVVEYFKFDLPKTASGKYSLTEKNIKKYCRPCRASGFLLGNSELGTSDIVKIQDMIHMEKVGEKLNISSKKQMGEIVFDYMGIEPLSTTAKGSPQFNDTLINKLADDGHGWAIKLHSYNKLCKIDGTYLKGVLDNTDDGVFYPYFKQHGTVSGRLSSNIQQLPRPIEPGDEGLLFPEVVSIINKLRSLFKARPGYKMIICDQSSLEPRVFATVSNDMNLINVFLNGEDLYSRVAIQAFKLEGYSAVKSDDNYLKKHKPELRQRAKAIALAIPYGAGAYQISRVLDITVEEAQDLIDAYLEAFKQLAIWMAESKEFVQKNGYIKTKSGRVRHLPKVKQLYSKYGDKLLDFKFRKHLEKKIGREETLSAYRDYKNGINNSRNVQIQGLSASIMNRSFIEIQKQAEKEGVELHTLMQIHDEGVFEAREEDVDKVCKIVQNCMENTYSIPTKLEAIPNVADNFGEGHD